MLKSFITSYKLKNTYRVNTVIYSIRQFPLIKNILPGSLYRNEGLKSLVNVLCFLYEIQSLMH